MNPLLLRVLPYIAAVLLVAGALFGVYHHGLSVKDAEWQATWSARDTKDAQAKAENEAAQRAKEQAYQQSINKAVQDGQHLIDQAKADAATARTAADSLRGTATPLPLDSQPVKAAVIPALPPQARQLPAPLYCSPTCSSALTKEREIWRSMLINATDAE